MKAAESYLKERGHHIIGIEEDFIFSSDSKSLAVTEVSYRIGKFPEARASRKLFEDMANMFLKEYGITDRKIMFNRIDMAIVGDNANIRYETNCCDEVVNENRRKFLAKLKAQGGITDSAYQKLKKAFC